MLLYHEYEVLQYKNAKCCLKFSGYLCSTGAATSGCLSRSMAKEIAIMGTKS
uniref:Uncharacterized protein n=1 Tax=Arundo donax TaxID=35708 RepID=A0A0A8YGK4_ARUDO